MLFSFSCVSRTSLPVRGTKLACYVGRHHKAFIVAQKCGWFALNIFTVSERQVVGRIHREQPKIDFSFSETSLSFVCILQYPKLVVGSSNNLLVETTAAIVAFLVPTTHIVMAQIKQKYLNVRQVHLDSFVVKGEFHNSSVARDEKPLTGGFHWFDGRPHPWFAKFVDPPHSNVVPPVSIAKLPHVGSRRRNTVSRRVLHTGHMKLERKRLNDILACLPIFRLRNCAEHLHLRNARQSFALPPPASTLLEE